MVRPKKTLTELQKASALRSREHYKKAKAAEAESRGAAYIEKLKVRERKRKADQRAKQKALKSSGCYLGGNHAIYNGGTDNA